MSAQTHPTFKHIKSQKVDLLNLTAHEYTHTKTGAKHYHFDTDSNENVFLVGFRTVPMDSTGVAHILEHTSLCGSKKYPVRDPFFMMLRRSLNTFMNALTSSDWTAYPFASANQKDFNNLLDVYLDAVFFTRLDELDFKQEGHRLAFKSEDNSESDLVYKGVVYNEMKGAMSSTDSQLWHGLCEHLFTDSTYHYNSGGDPAKIVDLTYKALCDFHQHHYHPSNAIFMTYGNIPPEEHQANFEALALNQFEKSKQNIDVLLEKPFSQPKKVKATYPVQASDTLAHKTYHVMAWLLGPITDFKARMEAHFLNGVLLGDSASPLLAAIESSNIGEAPSSMCGLDDSQLQMSFLCGIEGSEPKHTAAFEDLVLNVLNNIAEKGVPKERLETVLHQLELSQRKMSAGHYPYGVGLILGTLAAAVHRGDVLETLEVDSVLTELRTEIENPEYIKGLVTRLLLNNTHRLTYTMEPDATLDEKRQQALTQKLATLKKRLSKAEKDDIVAMSKALKERQSLEEDPSILPKVTLEDVPKTIRIPTVTVKKTLNKTHDVELFSTATNGLIYQDVIIQMPALSTELLALLPIYSNSLTELGCGKLDYKAMNAKQSKLTGGVSMRSTFKADIHNEQQFQANFILSSNALTRNQKACGELVLEFLDQVRFDETARLQQLIAQLKSSWNDSIIGNGHSYAMAAASSKMSPLSHLGYSLSGLKGIAALNQRERTLDEPNNINALAEQLSAIHAHVKKAFKSFLVITEENNINNSVTLLESLWKNNAFLGSIEQPLNLPSIRQASHELWVCNTQVNFCSKAYPTVPFGHKDYAKLLVLSGFLRNGYLHQAIREQGGAYGGGANQDRTSASFRFYSYRDPRGLETLKDFDQSIDWLLSTKHNYRPLEEAILGVISTLDKPGTPVSEARAAYYDNLYGITPAVFHQLRQEVLAVTINDLQAMATTYFTEDKASIAILTNEQGAKETFSSLGLNINRLEKPT